MNSAPDFDAERLSPRMRRHRETFHPAFVYRGWREFAGMSAPPSGCFIVAASIALLVAAAVWIVVGR